MSRIAKSARPIFSPLVAGVLACPLAAVASDAGPGAARLPNVTLQTHEGKEVRFYDDLIKGKIVVINFMYANCDGICPGQTANLVELQKALGDRVGRDVFIYSITLDPARDTTDALAQYAKAYKVKPGWSFLTGDLQDIELLRRTLGFSDPDPERDKDRSQHIGLVLVGNEALSRWAACPALSDPPVLQELVGWMKEPEQAKVAAGNRVRKAPPACPVDRSRGTIPVAHDGRTYYVCSHGCKEKFTAAPEKILATSTRKRPDKEARPGPETPSSGGVGASR